MGVLIEMEGGVVLIKRGGHVKPGQWALPSGYIEADESVEEAAVREAREETGLEIQLEDLVGIYSFPEGPPTSGIIVFYRARPVGGALRAGDDAVDARVVINAAGLFGDHVESFARQPSFSIRPRKGQFIVFDKHAAELVSSIVLPVPSATQLSGSSATVIERPVCSRSARSRSPSRAPQAVRTHQEFP